MRIICMILAVTRHHLWLMRNFTRHEGIQITFKESYLKLKYYLSSHIKLLLLTKTLMQSIKDKLNGVLNCINLVLHSGISEHDI